MYLTFAAVFVTLAQTNGPLRSDEARGAHDLGILLWLALVVPMVWLAAHRKANWARWTLLTLFLVQSLWLYFRARHVLLDPAYSTWVGVHVFLTILEGLAYVFAFIGGSHRWFAKEMSDVTVF